MYYLIEIFVCLFILFYFGWVNNLLGRIVFGVVSIKRGNEKKELFLSNNFINSYLMNLIFFGMLLLFIFWYVDILDFILVVFVYILEIFF